MKYELFVICNILIINELVISSEAVDLWKYHLQLYTGHCSEVALCDDVTNHLEPLEILALVPCCVPCSCLPTCSKRQNCCPNFGDSAKNLTGNQTIGNEFELHYVKQSYIGLDNGADTDNNTSRKWALKGSQNLKIAHPRNQSQRRQLASEIIGTTAATLGVDTVVNTVCIRPQILHEPNEYLDSDGFRMVTTCKETFRDKKISDKCHTAMEKKDIIEMLPVTSERTNLTYINRFCLMCNEANLTDDDIVDFWDAKIVTYANYYYHRFVLNPNELIDSLKGYNVGNSNIHFTPRSSYVVQQCEAYDIRICNETGLWENYDEIIETVCHYGQSLPILHLINYNHRSLMYKNIACVHCNVGSGFSDSSLSCRNSVTFDYRDYDSKSYSQTLNLRITNPDGATENGSIHTSYTDKAVLQLPKTKACQRGYIALLGFCRRVICPCGQYISNSRCVPLYHRLTGMDLNVKVDVFPSKNIPKKFASYFLDELWLIVNTSMSKCVTLKSNATSVWYGPIGRIVPNKYYMFDIYLFNTSNTIYYSVAVKEVRDFFNELKTYGDLTLPDGTLIGLHVKFNHRLNARFGSYRDKSVNTGGTLRPLVGKLLDRRPNMMISNVNWCYRVAFDEAVGDVQVIDSGVFLIKPANITLYWQKLDSPNTERDGRLLYLCTDLFKNYANTDDLGIRTLLVNKKGQQGVSNPSIPPNDRNSGSSERTSPVSIIIVSVLGLLVIVAGLYCVRFTTIKPRGQTGVHVSLDILNIEMSDRRENM